MIQESGGAEDVEGARDGGLTGRARNWSLDTVEKEPKGCQT